MDTTNSSLLPHVLQVLSSRPEMCETYENLCNEIKNNLSRKDPESQIGDVEGAIINALDVGEDLGILTIIDDLVRTASNFNKDSAKAIPLKKRNMVARHTEKMAFWTQPRRTHTMRPALKAVARRRGKASRIRRRRDYRRRSRSRRR